MTMSYFSPAWREKREGKGSSGSSSTDRLPYYPSLRVLIQYPQWKLTMGPPMEFPPRLLDYPPQMHHRPHLTNMSTLYGAHQMALIRKRLRVEMWMYDKLQELYGMDEVEIDLDEVLDMDDEMERREYIFSKASRETVNVFVGDLLAKVKTL
ncbi:PPP1R14B [Lepeophtheirus salmonis]|uniref:PPP1R14B n=1 Tax=Lepeophtheirus salmonis TaxID=72036 RepID=A0A7R8D677_LEPSM|nr:PPP1R14B [Lepeophtheirus salmonis]CAF3014841.1 PPP1R14B [Lepeophtheirus salmonis]